MKRLDKTKNFKVFGIKRAINLPGWDRSPGPPVYWAEFQVVLGHLDPHFFGYLFISIRN